MRRPRAAVIAAALLAPFGCSTSSSDTGAAASSERLLVLAASSLTDAVPELIDAFERGGPGVDVEMSFGGSSSLALAIEEGSPADVFVSADKELIDRLADRGLVDAEAVVIAANEVVLAAPVDSPIRTIDDFTEAGYAIGACAAQVPCGGYADRLFAAAGIEPAYDTREPNVRAVVAKLRDRVLDGGVVYRSDLVAFPDQLREIPVPEGISVTASITAGVLADASNPSGATAFVEFLGSDDAAAILTDNGFDAP